MIHRPPSRTRRGFTIIEMLTVVFLIILLVSIAVAAYSKIVNSMAAKATGTALQTAQAMWDEYLQAVPLASLGYAGKTPDPYFPYLGGNNTTAADLAADSTPPSARNRPIGIGSSTLMGLVGQGADHRSPNPIKDKSDNVINPSLSPPNAPFYPLQKPEYPQNAVYNTACVSMYLMRVSTVSQLAGKLPAKSLLSSSYQGSAQPIELNVGTDSQAKLIITPVLLDGWGNPIIFVPAGGLVATLKVGPIDSITAKPTAVLKLIRSSGIIPGGTAAYVPTNPPALLSNDRPFWASAGADGNFDTGDDNVYSFQ